MGTTAARCSPSCLKLFKLINCLRDVMPLVRKLTQMELTTLVELLILPLHSVQLDTKMAASHRDAGVAIFQD